MQAGPHSFGMGQGMSDIQIYTMYIIIVTINSEDIEVETIQYLHVPYVAITSHNVIMKNKTGFPKDSHVIIQD